MQHEAVLILPTQLFEKHPLVDPTRLILLVEHERYFSAYAFHKQKLIIHRATMRMYYEYLISHGHQVVYVEHPGMHACIDVLAKKSIHTLYMCDPVDIPLQKELERACKKHTISLHIEDTPLFLNDRATLDAYFADKKQVRHHDFYQAQRKRLDVLMTPTGKPVGGAWSFDTENRQACPDDVHIPRNYTPRHDAHYQEAYAYVQKFFKDNPGDPDTFWFPVTFVTAKKWLHDFLEHRFAEFGTYQDAIRDDQLVLFHAVLSPMLNIGLLTPAYVLDEVLKYADTHHIVLASLEGFIRQLIGWREYVRGVYVYFGDQQRTTNFFVHKRPLPKAYWNATTGLPPVDDAIKQTLTYAYTHHIVRLMVLGNSMLLQQIDPDHVYDWFMALYIDAYDWVMVPNVYGMSQYADGGLITTKPYISGSSYILRMSNYTKGAWTQIWDALYWHFIYTHRVIISKNYRLAMMAATLKRMDAAKLQTYIRTAQNYIKEK